MSIQMSVRQKLIVIAANFVFSVSLAATGFIGMARRDLLYGVGNEWSTLMWIFGLVTLFLIPLEVCVIKSPKKEWPTRGKPRFRHKEAGHETL